MRFINSNSDYEYSGTAINTDAGIGIGMNSYEGGYQLSYLGAMIHKIGAMIHKMDTNVTHMLKTPITSIMIPTTLLSVFLLMTMTLFLLFHVMFQIFVYVANRFFSHHNGNGDNNGINGGNGGTTGGGMMNNHYDYASSPIIMGGIIILLILESVLPWISFALGFYLSFSIGGVTWCIFTASTYLVWFGLRGLRSVVMASMQNRNGPRL